VLIDQDGHVDAARLKLSENVKRRRALGRAVNAPPQCPVAVTGAAPTRRSRTSTTPRMRG
jgi:hypothetical protein